MAVNSEPAAQLEHKGYNRGLILGLTMAESMLLLVFCLLLVAAAIINNERLKANRAENELKVVQEQLVAAKQEIATVTQERDTAKATVITLTANLEDLKLKLRSAEEKLALAEKQLKQAEEQLHALTLASADREKFEKEWRDLQLAKQQLQELKDLSVTPESVKKDRSDLLLAKQELQHLKNLGVTIEKVEEFKKTLTVLKENGLPTEDNAALAARLKELKAAEKSLTASKPHEWPPIINLSEADGNYFRSGSAELEASFEAKLRGTVSNQIADALQKYQVDVIEVVGHTDEQPISRKGSNLDQTVMDVLDGKKSIAGVVPADNAGLGLARAVSVANVLKSEGKLNGATILPLSAAQLILPGDMVTTGQAGAEEKRRRIEIRIRRRNQDQQITQ